MADDGQTEAHDAPGGFRRGQYAPEDPADRHRTVRTAVRVLVLDPDDRILLLNDSDPLLPRFSWWVTPGGGIDPGETERAAAVREVAEETGHRTTEDALLGPLARRRVVHGYADEIFEQAETFYAVRVDRFEVDTAGHTEDEKLTLTGSRWWPREELATTDAWIWPKELLELWSIVDRPDRWGIDLGLVTDESTRPV